MEAKGKRKTGRSEAVGMTSTSGSVDLTIHVTCNKGVWQSSRGPERRRRSERNQYRRVRHAETRERSVEWAVFLYINNHLCRTIKDINESRIELRGS